MEELYIRFKRQGSDFVAIPGSYPSKKEAIDAYYAGEHIGYLRGVRPMEGKSVFGVLTWYLPEQPMFHVWAFPTREAAEEDLHDRLIGGDDDEGQVIEITGVEHVPLETRDYNEVMFGPTNSAQ